MRMAGSSPATMHLALVCGRYEGIDERARALADREVSIGDYVLTGGELPALVVIDAVARLVPGVIEDASSASDSFAAGPAGAPAVHPTRGLRRRDGAVDPAVGSPRRSGSLAPARGPAANPDAPPRPAGSCRPGRGGSTLAGGAARGHGRLTLGLAAVWRWLPGSAGLLYSAGRGRAIGRVLHAPQTPPGAASADKPRLRPR